MRHALPLIWRKIPERYNLLGSTCQNCGTSYYPERKICPKCRRHGKLVEQKMPETGKIITYTEVHAAPKGFEHETPYHLAIIELDNGAKLMAQVVDSPKEKVIEGARVQACFRKIFEDNDEGAIAYGTKFKVIS